MKNNRLAHIRSAKAKIRLSKKLMRLCKKTNDRELFGIALDMGAVGSRELAQRINCGGVRTT